MSTPTEKEIAEELARAKAAPEISDPNWEGLQSPGDAQRLPTDSGEELAVAAKNALEVMERAKKLLKAAGLLMDSGTISGPYNAAMVKLSAALSATPPQPSADEPTPCQTPHCGMMIDDACEEKCSQCGHGLHQEPEPPDRHP